MSALLALEDIHTAYGLSRVLFGITLEVMAGECVCLLGRNGVGKTTTMRSVMGLTPPKRQGLTILLAEQGSTSRWPSPTASP